ncbi:molybdopterin converting factor small subunit [Desulfobaculum xiamenense]|uniref:Molybdopterin converting factor small subunit n=1 Tax=Desulfobaculum xiamenense TaxID=995050 RepID=A0A846QP99_9BACT|nr:MoaD/ThiS family protein [Desulfobaculum xiamenense]NJB68133.1 molybdopterin converting factor small subunit [Desulfobaculum xiamenense]
MKITVKCFATLKSFEPAEAEAFELPDETTVGGLMGILGIDPEEVKIMFINSRHTTPEAVIADGDRVGLFPAVGGG